MKKYKKSIILLFIVCCLIPASFVCAQNESISVIKFKDVDIKIVLQSIAQKAYKEGQKINIVVSPEVQGLVSINLEQVDWFTALEAVIRPYNYSYEWVGENIVLVDTTEKISGREASAKERQEVEPARTKVYRLKFIDANDARKMIEPLLSPMGRISVLETTGQAGWEFGTDVTKRQRVKEGKTSRTKIMVVSDIAKKLDEIDTLFEKIDVMPKQILIKTRIMEVSKDVLEDFGLDWGTGTTGATASSAQYVDADKNSAGDLIGQAAIRAISPIPSISSTPSGASGITSNAYQFLYRKLTGTEFEMIIHALEEDVRTNTLSAPVILTLNNQEASILVGQKYPIVKTETSSETSQITGGSLDFYQDIGIQLNVVPQICGENEDFISMIVHPAVTARLSDIGVVDQNQTTLVSYPWLTSREAETQVITKDGETIVIGGLLKDVKSRYDIGIPYLSKIPLIGWLFKRQTEDIDKIDLLIFITAEIVQPGEIFGQDLIRASQIPVQFNLNEKKEK
ncbi:MAG: hypothetical protein K9L86_04470 [Candidatus Omnitrophica bacterium]|nr:hypothetical protein [Candidatus Omnitrophota bacterium]